MVRVDGFSIGTYEVTQSEWVAIMEADSSNFQKGDNSPVETVSWFNVQEYIKKLNALTGKTYRLPTEDQWDRACRGGGPEQEYCGGGGDDVGAVAWYDGNSNGSTHPVGRKEPNRLGIYDMSGNVGEWTSSRLGGTRVHRGGSWIDSRRLVRSADRGKLVPGSRGGTTGFRLAQD